MIAKTYHPLNVNFIFRAIFSLHRITTLLMTMVINFNVITFDISSQNNQMNVVF